MMQSMVFNGPRGPPKQASSTDAPRAASPAAQVRTSTKEAREAAAKRSHATASALLPEYKDVIEFSDNDPDDDALFSSRSREILKDLSNSTMTDSDDDDTVDLRSNKSSRIESFGSAGRQGEFVEYQLNRLPAKKANAAVSMPVYSADGSKGSTVPFVGHWTGNRCPPSPEPDEDDGLYPESMEAMRIDDEDDWVVKWPSPQDIEERDRFVAERVKQAQSLQGGPYPREEFGSGKGKEKFVGRGQGGLYPREAPTTDKGKTGRGQGGPYPRNEEGSSKPKLEGRKLDSVTTHHSRRHSPTPSASDTETEKASGGQSNAQPKEKKYRVIQEIRTRNPDGTIGRLVHRDVVSETESDSEHRESSRTRDASSKGKGKQRQTKGKNVDFASPDIKPDGRGRTSAGGRKLSNRTPTPRPPYGHKDGADMVEWG